MSSLDDPNRVDSYLEIGKKMVLYKHNEEPKPGDKASKGYKRLVYAEPLN